MARSPEKKSSGLVLPAALGVGALGVAGYFGADKLAEMLTPEPELPERVVATRPPISLAVAFDRTPSDIRHELAGVKAATQELLVSGGLLQQGDEVTICDFAEHANCDSFPVGADGKPAAAGLARLDAVQTERGRDKTIETHVATSVGDVARHMDGKPNPLIAVWSDAEDEGDVLPDDTKLPGPVKIVYPKPKFADDAEAVASDLAVTADGNDAKAVLAGNAVEFKNSLAGFTSALTAAAQGRAQAEADRAYAEAIAAYQETLTGRKAKIEAVRSVVRGILLTITAICGTAIGALIWKRNKPRLKGYLVDKRGDYSSSQPLPRRKSWRADVIMAIDSATPLVFTASRDRVFLNGQQVTDGQEIVQGVFYYETPPTQT